MADDLILFAKEKEGCWLRNATDLLNASAWPANKLVAELAFLCDISIATSKRYLYKFSSPSGPLLLASGMVSLKDQEQPF